jgi:hypothetical protein
MRKLLLLGAAAALAAPPGLAMPASAQQAPMQWGWDAVPQHLQWCRLTVQRVVQDNAGQPLRLTIRNDSGQRVQYVIAITAPRVGNIGPQTGRASVDNANPGEVSVTTSTPFQGDLRGQRVRLALESCSVRR